MKRFKNLLVKFIILLLLSLSLLADSIRTKRAFIDLQSGGIASSFERRRTNEGIHRKMQGNFNVGDFGMNTVVNQVEYFNALSDKKETVDYDVWYNISGVKFSYGSLYDISNGYEVSSRYSVQMNISKNVSLSVTERNSLNEFLDHEMKLSYTNRLEYFSTIRETNEGENLFLFGVSKKF